MSERSQIYFMFHCLFLAQDVYEDVKPILTAIADQSLKGIKTSRQRSIYYCGSNCISVYNLNHYQRGILAMFDIRWNVSLVARDGFIMGRRINSWQGRWKIKHNDGIIIILKFQSKHSIHLVNIIICFQKFNLPRNMKVQNLCRFGRFNAVITFLLEAG